MVNPAYLAFEMKEKNEGSFALAFF